MQGEKDKERAAQVIADFKIVFDKWYKKSRNLRVLQEKLSNILYDKTISYSAKFEIVNLVIFGLPKGLRSIRRSANTTHQWSSRWMRTLDPTAFAGLSGKHQAVQSSRLCRSSASSIEIPRTSALRISLRS